MELPALPELSGQLAQQAREDLALIARGEELDLPWGRLRILLSHELVEVVSPVLTGGSLRGSRHSLTWTDAGTRFMRESAN